MTFDIYQSVFDKKSGEYIEKAGRQYCKELEDLFKESVEGKTLSDEGIEAGWCDYMLELGMVYQGVTPAQMSAADLRTILFELIPRKISALAEQAPDAIRELQLFWTFLQREFRLKNAEACLKVLNDKETVSRLREEMDKPTNFGMAKSFVMMGKQRGFNMTSQEGVEEWMAIYNDEIKAGTAAPPVSLPSLPSLLDFPELDETFESGEAPEILIQSSKTRKRAQADKAKRKMAKSSRKQNRSKK